MVQFLDDPFGLQFDIIFRLKSEGQGQMREFFFSFGFIFPAR
jgi:hypothetical protein